MLLAKGGRLKKESYEEFVEKFKPKKTTDDCITPPEVYKAICNWACDRYKIDPGKVVRPFWPGANYQKVKYPEGCVVIDNPPFSILSKIVDYYLQNGIDFFLFAPTLTAFSAKKTLLRTSHIIAGASIVYENGAIVNTSFLTSFEPDITVQTAPELQRAIKRALKESAKGKTKRMPHYTYPNHVLTAAMADKYCNYGIDYRVKRNECQFISRLDSQKRMNKTIYGGGLLLSEKAAAEKAAAIEWELSDREIAIINNIGKGVEECMQAEMYGEE